MEILRHVLVLLHLVGFASLFGGFLVQLRARRPEVNAAMLHGVLTALVTGVALVIVVQAEAATMNYLKIGVKLLITVLITLLVVKNRKFQFIPKGLWGLIGGMTFVNAGVAVLWQ